MNPQAFDTENGLFPALPPDKSIASREEAP
jgi:hypothetical protein